MNNDMKDSDLQSRLGEDASINAALQAVTAMRDNTDESKTGQKTETLTDEEYRKWFEVGKKFALEFSEKMEASPPTSGSFKNVALSSYRLTEYLELNFSGKMLPGIFSYLDSEDEDYQFLGIIVVDRIGRLTKRKDECISALMNALDQVSQSNRILILKLLGAARVKAITPDLIEMLSDENESIKKMAIEALSSIKGSGFFFGNSDPSKWKKWWSGNK